MSHPTNPQAVRVKRDGGRGWHWVAAFDPDKHELFDAEPDGEESPDAEPKPARRKK